MTPAGVRGWGGHPIGTPPSTVAPCARSGEPAAVSTPPTPAPGSGLHQCLVCHDDYVVPVWWEEVGDERWHMLLRCAQCDTYRDVVVTNDVARVFERDLQRGMDQIAASADRTDRARMVAEVDVLIAALEHDLIDAGDFATR